MSDSWIHRSKHMLCGACMFFVEKKCKTKQKLQDSIGRCRKHSPTLDGWPAVFPGDWCGDHKIDEEKLK
ncbi:MAG: hypothetical protein KAS32_02555 [Candidatus Peribacteraceae bacterium]|nr:hypothetical protein [Candidatus Peribacteraceae bacterium]